MRTWRINWSFLAVKLNERNAEQAVVRELQKRSGLPHNIFSLFEKLEYEFPDRHITLWFWLVESWEGEPWGKEGQTR